MSFPAGAEAPTSSDDTTSTTVPSGTGDAEAPVADTAPDDTIEDEVEPPFDPGDPAQILREIVFPVVGASSYSPTFGACRDGCTRLHEGIDIMTYGWKGVPVVAAHDGVVTWANVGGALAGCGIVITADDGWSTVYTHLNTDQPGTDDGTAPCFPAGIDVGAEILAGTLIGWVGDAGNAEETPPHLHFEIRHPDHGAVDPMVSLDAAHRIEHRWIDPVDIAELAPTMWSEATTVYVVPSHAIDLVAAAASELAVIDVPLVAFDADDPIPAWASLRALEPERIVAITDDPTLPFLADLASIAPIVELTTVEPEPEPPVIPNPDGITDVSETDEPHAPAGHGQDADERDEGRIDHFDAHPDDGLVVFATRRTPSSGLVTGLGDHPVIVLLGSRTVSDVGQSSSEHPGADANRNGLWWPTADGWRIADDVDEQPPEAIAYAAGGDLQPWVLTYLATRDAAPHLPYWHYQPMSRVTRSL